MKKKKIKFMCTAFRDGFQSAYGARVFTRDFLPAVEAAREAGINYFEAGGGALFQSLYFYCNEDAFAMMDEFRRCAGPDADLQTLARGVNVVGLESQPADIISLHARLFKKHGISTIRNFDALNDVENLIHSGRAIVDAGLRHQVCVTMMELPPGCSGAHDPDFYESTLRRILEAEIPFDSVCFKDASGTSVPATVYQTIKRARKILPAATSIHFHTHETAGISLVAYQAALEAGADAIDLSLAPCSGGTCQPDLLVMWHALRGSNYELDIDPLKVLKAEEVFKDCMKDYFMPPEATAVEPLIPWSPMPGGALTTNTQMLRDNGIMDKYPELIKAMGEVVRAGGFGTSVTPVSQFYFQQAFNNVIFGPWQKIAEPYGRMVLGYFGRTPVPPDPRVVALAREQIGLEPTTESPIERNNRDPKKGVEAARKILREQNLPESDENIFIVATCGEKGVTFLQGRAEIGVRKLSAEKKEAADPLSGIFSLTIDGRPFEVALEGEYVRVNGTAYKVDLQAAGGNGKPEVQTAAGNNGATPIKAPMPGKVWKITARVGEKLRKGDTVLVLEAMKMETRLNTPVAGTVREIKVAEGDMVQTGVLLASVVPD